MQVLVNKSGYSVIKLDETSEPYLALRSSTLFDLLNLLNACHGFVAGVSQKEDAVLLSRILDRLNEIAEEYATVSTAHGYELEVPKPQAKREFERAIEELDEILSQLDD